MEGEGGALGTRTGGGVVSLGSGLLDSILGKWVETLDEVGRITI